MFALGLDRVSERSCKMITDATVERLVSSDGGRTNATEQYWPGSPSAVSMALQLARSLREKEVSLGAQMTTRQVVRHFHVA